jgi:tetratricopeptide (TPR) repeat protein
LSILAAVLVASSLAAVAFYGYRRAHIFNSSDSIVLADFVNKTGDPLFDETLRWALAGQLRQSPYFRLVSGYRIQSALALMSEQPDSPLNAETSAAVCHNTGSKAYVTGSIEGSNGSYSMHIVVVGCQAGQTIASAESSSLTRDTILRTIALSSQKIRKELGESADSIQRFGIPDQDEPSLEGLHSYAQGLSTAEGRGKPANIGQKPNYYLSLEQRSAMSHFEDAVPLFQQATRFDPTFAMAYQALAKAYWDQGENVPATENLKKAVELRSQLGPRDRFAVDAADNQYRPSFSRNNVPYLGTTPERYGKLLQIYKEWSQTYSEDSEPRRALGSTYLELGQDEKALQEFREAFRLEPDVDDPFNHDAPEPYAVLVGIYRDLNHLSEASALLGDNRSRVLPPYQLQMFRFCQDDQGSLESLPQHCLDEVQLDLRLLLCKRSRCLR